MSRSVLRCMAIVLFPAMLIMLIFSTTTSVGGWVSALVILGIAGLLVVTVGSALLRWRDLQVAPAKDKVTH